MRDLAKRDLIALGLVYVLSSWLFGFAYSYWQIGPPGFNEDLSRLDATYFALTTASTTGFGDIAPTSPLARGVVSAQMITGFDLLVIGVASVLSGRDASEGHGEVSA